ncbi:hypothetical protein [Paractinoplanes brasiliensis]|uniref:Uncharacterized protein n=1 Tax=Paractinoplanes brasiliensis TaxID=52695 RepID=A0A4V3C5W0_9ACTN|nr:hypothetical protein [Actinoplanes brasiliensis]TDO31408.1 hypothetical protein C8E87_6830 [Actinoplanes brasiliensis]GID30804.1 hypothetical protein Abr02nite_57870 [Actinoplanes brasiliensis]
MTVDDQERTAPQTHPVVLPRISADPLDMLVDRMRPALARAVETLQVAAALEADGVTDRIARVEYGFPDVFALAAEVFRRLGPPADDPPAPAATGHGRRQTVRLLLHGPLYALPSAVFPAVLVVVGQRHAILALTLAGVLGWAYAGTVAFAAYKLLGANRPRRAARLLRFSALAAPLLGALAGAVLGRWSLVLLAGGQLTYQLAGTVLMFYRRELWQALAMAPAVVAGVAYLFDDRARDTALIAAGAGVLAAFTAALWCTFKQGSRDELPARLSARGLAGVTAYGILSALLLLHAALPYLSGRLDIAVAVAPLILSMGFVEWRAERFRALAVGLTRTSRRPADFEEHLTRAIGLEILLCAAVPAGLGVVLLAGLRATDPAVFVMVLAHVLLGGAYYVAFLLAGFERFGRLCASLIAALVLHLGAVFLLGRSVTPLTDTVLFTGSVFALLALFLLGLAPSVRQVRHYR